MSPRKPYLTAPVKTTGMPSGIPYIISNEAAERFSFYGMRCILTIFMTKYLVDSTGALDLMTDDQAKEYFHLFVCAVYFLPFFGALLSDTFWGKYRTIFWLSIVYCLGHLALALDVTRLGLATGLILISFGSGGIKPCVSAHVGDQFGKTNEHLVSGVFGWFYFAINMGSFSSYLIIPYMLEHYGPHVAFGIPGLFMAAATLFFWMGRYKFVHIPPGGTGFLKETFSEDGLKCMLKLGVIYFFTAMFWALYDQTGSSWILQAEKMDCTVFGFKLLESQIQAVNPILILVFIPLTSYVIYPAIEKVIPFGPMRRISVGMFVAAVPFLICAWVATRIDAGYTPHIVWQLIAYVFLTIAEILISITSLEFSYTQAPKKMKSFIVSFYLMSMSLGNLFTSQVNRFIQNEDGSSKLEGAAYFMFFVYGMLIFAVIFMFVSMFIKTTMILQDEESGATAEG